MRHIKTYRKLCLAKAIVLITFAMVLSLTSCNDTTPVTKTFIDGEDKHTPYILYFNEHARRSYYEDTIMRVFTRNTILYDHVTPWTEVSSEDVMDEFLKDKDDIDKFMYSQMLRVSKMYGTIHIKVEKEDKTTVYVCYKKRNGIGHKHSFIFYKCVNYH